MALDDAFVGLHHSLFCTTSDISVRMLGNFIRN